MIGRSFPVSSRSMFLPDGVSVNRTRYRRDVCGRSTMLWFRYGMQVLFADSRWRTRREEKGCRRTIRRHRKLRKSAAFEKAIESPYEPRFQQCLPSVEGKKIPRLRDCIPFLERISRNSYLRPRISKFRRLGRSARSSSTDSHSWLVQQLMRLA